MARPPSPLPPLICGLDPTPRRPSVFSTPAARRAGVPRHRLRRADLESLGVGLWRVRDREPDRADLLRALQDLHPSAAFSHVTALQVWGLAVPWRRRADPVHLSLPGFQPMGSRRREVAVHERSADVETHVVDGVRVSTPPWAFMETAALGASVEDLVVVGDSICRVERRGRPRAPLPPGVLGADGPAALRALVERRAGARGVVAARAAVALVRPGADSPQETRLRLRLGAEPGIPEPAVNPPVRLATGEVLHVDLVWEHARVAVEYDGDWHRTDPVQWRRDRERDASLRAEGWAVIRVTSDVFTPHGWAVFLLQLRAALGSGR